MDRIGNEVDEDVQYLVRFAFDCGAELVMFNHLNIVKT